MTTKSFCNQCVGERNHAILHTESESGRDEEHDYEWTIKYDMLKCLGCDTVSMRRTATDSVSCDDSGRPLPTITFYPPAIFRRQPEWVAELELVHIFDLDKAFLTELLKEIYVDVQNNCGRSAVMAIRALLEQVMIDKVGDNGSFLRNMTEFHIRGFISSQQKGFLETVIEAGHATIHRAFKPSKDDIVALVNITESVIEAAYVNEHRASKLQTRIPRKPTAKKKLKPNKGTPNP